MLFPNYAQPYSWAYLTSDRFWSRAAFVKVHKIPAHIVMHLHNGTKIRGQKTDRLLRTKPRCV